jgi:hypothetical protein
MRRYYWSTTHDLKAYVWGEVTQDRDNLQDVSAGATEEQMRKHPVLSVALDLWRAGDDTIFAEAMGTGLMSAFDDTPAGTWSDHEEVKVCREHMDIPVCAAAVDLAERIDAINAERGQYREEMSEAEHELMAEIKDLGIAL